MQMIKVEIKIETDCDFVIILPRDIQGLKSFNRDEYEHLNLILEFEERKAKECLISFLKDFDISTHKSTLHDNFNKNKDSYVDELHQGLRSSYDLLGGGNWSFCVHVSRFTIEEL